ncbi:hypothetical protein [Synechococcus sp. N19]|uniref:hypothetical protein n=1 Tax=Synechococcus sp. N19 TaxID=2575512 RepID=UPI001FCC6981|nr:hypothetical protein [Synechococcus sp. N19]
MVVDQQSLLEDKDRLEELRRSYDGEARLNESFIVLTVGASLRSPAWVWSPTTML